MINAIDTQEYKGYTIKVYPDDNPIDPRENDNLGTMVCFHRRYNLGDKHNLDSGDFNGWQEIYNYIKNELQGYIILPLYLYDHSGISMSTNRSYPYNDQWDAGQVGFIYISKADICREYSVKRISPQLKDRVTDYLIGEVKAYDNYIRGNVYGYVIEDQEGNNFDSCWGYDDYDYMIKECQDIIDRIKVDERELTLQY